MLKMDHLNVDLLSYFHHHINKNLFKHRRLHVRLGEYNTETTTDCDQDNDCSTNQHVDILVEQAIPHEGFDDSSANRHNDIALIRLSRNVDYGDFIKPVCMPWVVNGVQRTFSAGTNLTVAGWGRTLLGE